MRRIVAAAVLLTSCATTPSSDVFEHAERYEGRAVRVCGFVTVGFEDGNIWESRDSVWSNLPLDRPPTGGLALVGPYSEPTRRLDHLNGRMACLSGTIVMTGCDGEDNICNWTPFTYGLRVISERHSR